MRSFLLLGLLLLPRVCFAQDRPLPPTDAVKAMTVPKGFAVDLVAGEPDLSQPIAFTFDDRGRLWVVECFSYPDWKTDGTGTDRVTILEDKDRDGRFETKKVFYDKGSNLSGIALGYGGVWLCSTPNLIFIPDTNGDDIPDGPPQILLDGWDLKAKHNVFNSLRWGPDGRLWGCNGIMANAWVGVPGTPKEQRTFIGCGVWRFDPTSKKFEAVAHGTTNPWGLDFDDYGQAFITNCVIAHLWHVVPGAHFERMYGQDPLPHSYQLIRSIADHLHWAGGHWTSSRGGKGPHDEAGGGHAHSGAAVYLGERFPKEYRNTIFMCNIHGSRLNRNILTRSGSTYNGGRAPDFMFANDPWFRGIAVHQGPDGALYVCDWTDTGECHNYKEVDRTNGRIYRIRYGDHPTHSQDLAKLPDGMLIEMQTSENEWLVRQARRLLHERSLTGTLDKQSPKRLRDLFAASKKTTVRLRCLWALYVLGAADADFLNGLLSDPDEWLRAWAIRLLGEAAEPSASAKKFAALTDDSSALVRLHLASVAQRLPIAARFPILRGLAKHAEDTTDLYLPLMIWYALEPCVVGHPQAAIELANESALPIVRHFVARRLASEQGGNAVIPLLTSTNKTEVQIDFLNGIHAAFAGRRSIPPPTDWPALAPKLFTSDSPIIREQSLALALLFGDAEAKKLLLKQAADTSTATEQRTQAIKVLVQAQTKEVLPILANHLTEPSLRAGAIRGLAAFNSSETPKLLIGLYAKASDAEKVDIIQTLASRPTYALDLLTAVENEAVPRRDITPFVARQLAAMKDQTVTDKLTKVWGQLRAPAKERLAQQAKLKEFLTQQTLKKADLPNGRLLFQRNCANCHRLFDDGARIGPELTGAQRSSIDYILENVLDPSAVVGREYQMVTFVLATGRIVNGMVVEENEKTVVVQTANEKLSLTKADIEERTQSNVSMMPEGLFDKLTLDEIRDLTAYLASATQVELPKPK